MPLAMGARGLNRCMTGARGQPGRAGGGAGPRMLGGKRQVYRAGVITRFVLCPHSEGVSATYENATTEDKRISVMSYRVRTRHTYDGTRRDGRMT